MLTIASCQTAKVPVNSKISTPALKGNDLKNYNYLLSEAIKQKVLGNYGQSIVYFKQCLDINPESDAAMFELSTIYTFAGDYPEALKYARMAASADTDNLWYQLQMASLYHTMGLNDRNILIYENIVKKYPEKLDLLFQLGKIYSEENMNGKAIQVFNQLQDKVGFQESISLAKIEIYRRTGKTQFAENEIQNLLKGYPDNVNYQILLAELFFELGENEKAEKKYKELLLNYAKDDKIYISMIRFYQQNEDYDEMIKLLDSVLLNDYSGIEAKFKIIVSLISDPEILPEIEKSLKESLEAFKEKYSKDIRILALMGDFYVKTNQYELALGQFKAYLSVDIGNYLVWEQLLFLLNILEETDDLYIYSSRAIRLYPKSAIVYFFNGIACTQQEKNSEAIQVLRKGLNLVEKNNALLTQFYSLLGEAYKNIEKYEESDNAFESALNIESRNLIVLNNFSYYLSLRGVNLKKALKMSKICIETEPGNSTYLDTYGWVLFKMKKYTSSEKYLKRALENVSNPSAEILDHYGDVSAKLKKYERAVEYWKKALKAGGKEREIVEKIENASKKK